MTDADKRIEALLDRAGCPMMVVKNAEQKRFEDVRRSILRVADEQYDGSLIEYIRDLVNTIDRLEGTLENVIIQRDAALAKVPKWISVKERLPPPQTERYFVLIKTYEGIPATQTCVWAWNENDEVGEFLHWGDKIAYWMPLPEPPEEQKGEKAEG